MQELISFVNLTNKDINQKNLYQLSHRLSKTALIYPEEIEEYIIKELKSSHAIQIKDRFLFQLLTQVFRNNTRNNQITASSTLEKTLRKYLQYDHTPAYIMYQGALALLRGNREQAFKYYKISAQVANENFFGLPRVYLGANSIISPTSEDWVESEKRLPGIAYNTLRPTDNWPQKTLLFVADTNYYNNFHKDIINDLKYFNGSYQTHFHVVDWDDSIKPILTKQNLHSVTTEKFKYFRDRTYFATARFYRAIEFLQKYNTSLFISDIDNQIIKDPDQFFEDVKEFDVGLRFNSNSNWFPWWGPSAGSLYIANNEQGITFANLLKKYISHNFRVNKYSSTWWFDQLAINEVYHYCKKKYPKMRFADLNKINLHLSVVRKNTDSLQEAKWS